MVNILDEIYAHSRQEVAAAMVKRPVMDLEEAIAGMPPPPDFAAALKHNPSSGTPQLIAEVKRCSPSKGVLRCNFDPLDLAQVYAHNGAAAISVLTDEKYFGGSLEALRRIAALDLKLPLLRKDFIFDRYQLLEARAAGASAVLLIAAMLPAAQLRSLLAEARTLGLGALVETHTIAEVTVALEAESAVIGVNNRDLHTFEVSLEICLQLRKHIPPHVVMVAESGIRTQEDVNRLAEAGIDAILVGEALVTAVDVGAKVRELAKPI